MKGQKCLCVDQDGKDMDSVQVFASEGERIIGCLLKYQKEPGVLQIGRVAVIESQRGRDIGMQMMHQAISYVRDNLTDEKIYIEAQTVCDRLLRETRLQGHLGRIPRRGNPAQGNGTPDCQGIRHSACGGYR